jgi:hypothetical protein
VTRRILLLFSCAAAALVVPGPARACPWHKSKLVFGVWAPSSVLPLQEVQTLVARSGETAIEPLVVDDEPSVVGQWAPPQTWPVIAIHAALLPNGLVLTYGFPAGGPGSAASLWNPSTGTFEDVSLGADIFCSGMSQLPNGRFYATGGNDDGCDFQGQSFTHDFDPFTHQWRALGNMVTGRWYPSNVELGDGRTLILSGLDRQCETSTEMEVYTPDQGLSVIPQGDKELALYPRMHLLTSGLVAHVGPEPSTEIWNPVAKNWTFLDWMEQGGRYDGVSFLVPGYTNQVVVCGGSGATPPSKTCEWIDFNDASPVWRATTSMHYERSHHDATILPTREVLILGGGTNGLFGNPVLNPEIYDPDTEEWTVLPAHVYGRSYHSTTLLLPDGRVLAAGQNDGPGALKGEIYSPAYLFKGARPVVTGAPNAIAYGETFQVTTPQANSIQSVALITLGMVTHSVTFNQRYVPLPFTKSSGTLTLEAPLNGNHAPPGYYMLFVVNSNGVPSVAKFMKLGPYMVFDDSFESGDTSAWSDSSP